MAFHGAFLQTERLRHVLPGFVRGLGRGDDLHRPRVGVDQRHGGLHGGMDEVGHEVLRLQYLAGGREGFVDVPAVADDMAAGAGRGAELFVVGARVVGDVRAVVPFDREFPAAFEHRPGIGPDHRDAAQRVVLRRGVVGQSRYLHHLLDSLDRERFGGVVRLHLAAIDGRPRHDRDLHARDGDVGPEIGAPGAHVVVVDHRHVAADVLPLRGVLELRRGVPFRHRDVGGRVDHLAEVEGAPGGGMVEAVMFRVDLAGVDAPLSRRRLLQHVAARRAELPHDVEVVAGAARAVGVLAVLAGRVVLRLVSRRLPDGYPVPVRLQLVGQDHGDPGPHPLPHLGAAAGDGHRPVVGRSGRRGWAAPSCRWSGPGPPRPSCRG